MNIWLIFKHFYLRYEKTPTTHLYFEIDWASSNVKRIDDYNIRTTQAYHQRPFLEVAVTVTKLLFLDWFGISLFW